MFEALYYVPLVKKKLNHFMVMPALNKMGCTTRPACLHFVVMAEASLVKNFLPKAPIPETQSQK